MQKQDNKIKIFINNREILTEPGKTIIQVAEESGFKIPRLCYDSRLNKLEGQCGLCVVELENDKRYVQSCLTKVREGMDIKTNTEGIESYRRLRLEHLLSQHNADCIAPCVETCPAGIGIQTYLRQVANGNFRGALRVIKDKNPFPITCGRVCPHPCEAACRRNLIDTPVAINYVKRFVSDIDINSEDPYMPEKKAATGKRIAVIGAGPSGLSAAYFSAVHGHDVTVFERQTEPGGMLRYGIPDYRLPNETLDKEIEQIKRLGVKIQTGKKLGMHITLEDMHNDFDATFLAIGSCQANTLKIDGDRSRGVWLGISFLERITKGVNIELGDNVIVIGGGNTAIDCARTALRREGVKKVHLIYRRTQDEMPAEDYEIEEAIEEGIEMSFLMTPVRIEFDLETKKIKQVYFMKMELGPADRSGRRRPVPIEGEPEVCLEATAVIGAIGQSTDTSFLWDDLPVKLNKWGDIEINGKTMETSVHKVFSGGDCVTGPATVIQAVAAGKQAADCMNDFVLTGYVKEKIKDYSCSRGTLEDLPRHEFIKMPKIARAKMKVKSVKTRVKSFVEIENGISEEQAIKESSRCLRCGCAERNVCTLRKEASNHDIEYKRPIMDIDHLTVIKDHPFIDRDHNKCISCGLCVSVCEDLVGVGVLGASYHNGHLRIGTKTGAPLEETQCVSCGHCVNACPCGALDYKRESDKVFQALNDPNKIVVGFVAPAVRTVVAHHFSKGYDEVMPFIAGVLKSKKLGFDKVFDVSFTADLTIVEEATEFVSRIEKGEYLPQFSSCCPGWVNFVEKKYPELIPYLSTCKSPQQMFGSTVKNHYIKWAGLEDRKKDLFVVSIMPCIAKKDEAARESFSVDGIRDVDAVLTTSELFEMMRRTKVNPEAIESQPLDKPYSTVSGAGVIFGVSGGVAEAALRMAAEKLSGKPLENLDFNEIRGLEGVKEAEYEISGKNVRIAVVSGLKNAEPLIEQVLSCKSRSYDLIEVMTCPGGCIDGAGHPTPQYSRELTDRKDILTRIDKNQDVRKSQDNPDILNLYRDFYGEPNSELAHKLLHTHYKNRRRDDTNVLRKINESSIDNIAPVTIKVCVDKHCFKKGSHSLMDKLDKKIKELKLEERVKIKPRLCKGHCEDKEFFVSIDNKRVSLDKFNDMESFLTGIVSSKK
ncbi:MAG: FAD-dependent oxidoreductase [bacterium]|nr:FAD-dependent oxidoreductase [bacterium]